MPEPLKVLVDECIGSRRSLEAINHVLSIGEGDNPPEFVLVTDFMDQQGTKDKVWNPKAARAGFRLVLTTDQGNKKRGDKLPELCQKHGITHILMTSTLKSRGLKC